MQDADAAPEFDVAISFLSADEAIARALADQLEASGLKVFFFPHKQEELAGTNGMESMRAPFFSSRIVVALYKEPWGRTPWTRVEETAITERCLKQGWSSLMFVTLDKPKALPKWLPETHVRFAMQDYSIDQLVGAIKLRVQERGGSFRPPDAMSEAKRVQHEAEYLKDRERMMRDFNWIGNTVHGALRATLEEISRLAEKVNAEHGLKIVCRADDKIRVLRSGFVSLAVSWRQPIANNVGKDASYGDCYLRVAEFSGAVVLPQERLMVMNEPRLLKEHRFRVDVSHDRELVWLEDGKKEQIAPSALADRVMRLFLDLVSRANNGKVERPPL